MEPDDLPCSRNARPQKALVRRAHLRIDQATLKEMGDKEDGRSEGVNLFTKERKSSVPYFEPLSCVLVYLGISSDE
jgi:hypothetical protein